MKDYHFPAAVTIPAAIGLVGVLWFLHRKSGSNEERKRSVTALPKEKESTPNAETEEQSKKIETQGITVFQRKIPETLGRDRGSSDLRSKGSIIVADEISQVRPVFEKLAVGSDNNVGFGQDIVGVEVDLSQCDRSGVLELADITTCGESGVLELEDIATCGGSGVLELEDITTCGVLELEDITPCGESGIFGSPDITPCSESGIFGSPDITPCSESGVLDSADITPCGESGIFGSPDITPCSERAITQNGQDDCQKSVISQTCQFGTLKSLNVDHSQDDGLSSSQREYLEQQIIAAMEDGLKEAHRKISQPVNILKCSLQMLPDSEGHDIPSSLQMLPDSEGHDLPSSLQMLPDSEGHDLPSSLQMLPDSEGHDVPPRADLSVNLKVADEVLIHKTATVELEASVDPDQRHEFDLTNKTPTDGLPSDGATRDINLLPLLKDIDVDCAADTASSEDEMKDHAALLELPGSSSDSNSSSLLSLISSSVADFQPHVDIYNQAENDGSPAMTVKEDDQQNYFVSSCLPQLSSAVGPEGSSFSSTDSSSFRAKENTASKTNSVSSIKSISSERDERRSTSGRWLPKASTSSIDSFGPEEINAIWGLGSSLDYLDKELFFMDTDPVVTTKGLLDQATDLAVKLEDGHPLMPLLQVEDKAGVKDGLRGVSFQSCSTAAGTFADKSLSPGSLAMMSISPLGDNNSEGSNDSGRGGSEHDIIFPGSDALVHFDFNMPSEICGQFIGKHGKNINYLKGKTGAYVALTNSFLAPGYQVCQVSGSQAEVDEALSMIRQKFPLQDYPLLTMDPVSIPVPVPLQPDSQIVFPEVMQLSLPEGVSVDVYVSAVVDAGQVFVQQPTHRSFMSLEKLAYFLNLVYTQDPNVPSVPLPIESGVICVCESEGSWYRAMIMSPEDENGDVQVKFVDYGGYVTVPVSALKQIRADFMNLPFQAVECFMANITPNQSEKLFSSEATQALSDMTQGKLLQCQVVARTEYGMPYIHLYQINSESRSAVLINQALVNSRLVRWIEIL